MPASKPPHKNILTSPAQLSEAERAYYRETWGFDPVEDCLSSIHSERRYEASFPLAQDPPLQTAGLTIAARVEWKGRDIHNRIVIRRGPYEEAAVECTHTIVLTGRAEQAWTLAEDVYTAPDRLSEADMATLARGGGPVALPPWEHFAALKSYVAAVAEAGIVNLLKGQFHPREEGGEERPAVPFGFNADMQAQVTRALVTVVPDVVVPLLRELAAVLLDTAPPQWIVDHWEYLELHTKYPIPQVFDADPQRLLVWLQEWEKGAPNLFMPWDIRRELDPILKKHWQVVLRGWDAETVTRWCRHSDVLDGLQDYLFDTPEVLTQARGIDPALPWDQLRLEHKARWEEDGIRTDLDHRLMGGGYSAQDFPQDVTPAEVWPRAPCCVYVFPRAILGRDPARNTDATMRQKRYRRFLTEARWCYLDSDLREFITRDIRLLRVNLAEEVRKPFPGQLEDTFVELPHGEAKLRKMVASGHAEWRRVAAVSPDLPESMQAELANHWDYATRLSVCANPSVTRELLQKLAGDVQPCIQTMAHARLQRGGATIAPLVGEILDPGEILWLLVAHPTTYFQFGVTTWGDGSEDYAGWWAHQVAKNQDIESDIGRMNAWAYIEGFVCQDQPDYDRGRGVDLSLIALFGLGECACGRAPCMYLGAGNWEEQHLYYSYRPWD